MDGMTLELPFSECDVYEMGGTYGANLTAFQHDRDMREMGEISGVYVIESVDRHLYIGQSSYSMTERIHAHYSGRSNPFLYRRLLSAQQYNETIILTLYPLLPDEAKITEMVMVKQFSPVYNRRLR